MKTLMSFLFIMLLTSNANAQLSCSRNGTEVIYINGILVPKEKGASDVKNEINKIIIEQSDRFDLTNIYTSSTAYQPVTKLTTSYVYNQSTFLGDFIELAVGKLREKGDPNPYQTYAVVSFLGGSAVLGASAQLSRGMKAAMKVIGYPADYLLGTELKKSAEEIDTLRYSMEQLLDIDETVVTKLQEKITSALNNNKKVIIVSHSQGNVVTNDAISRLPAQINGVDKNRYLANLQVATPAGGSSALKSRSIKLTQDKVVGLFGASATYSLQGLYIDDLYNSGFGNLFTTHLMIPAYLNSNLKASKLPSESNWKTMPEIFKDNLEELATMFPDNCPSPAQPQIILGEIPVAHRSSKVSATASIKDDNGTKVFIFGNIVIL